VLSQPWLLMSAAVCLRDRFRGGDAPDAADDGGYADCGELASALGPGVVGGARGEYGELAPIEPYRRGESAERCGGRLGVGRREEL
jgi:hypothetical protein